MTSAFNLLTGAVRIGATAPAELLRDGLDAFYVEPNRKSWGGSICRILFHESVHFWQLLSWGYLANVVADEWLRLESFEGTKRILPRSSLGQGYVERGSAPFSAFELVECWARYWDVHTRSPALLVEEDKIEGKVHFETEDARYYTNHGFDHFMQNGEDARFYAAPYRTLLELADGDSWFVNAAFPALVHAAFGTPTPVPLLLEAFGIALKHRRAFERPPNINFAWLKHWDSFWHGAAQAARMNLRLPAHTTGFDVIRRGPLKTHPFYGAYLAREAELFARLGALRLGAEESVANAPPDIRDAQRAMLEMPAAQPMVVLAQPGQPDYRFLLGTAFPPPRVRFEDAVIDAHFLETHRRNAIVEMDALVRRVERFERAVQAVSRGLSHDAFEADT